MLKRINKIEKSWKKEGYVFVGLNGELKYRLRKLHTYKRHPGKGFINLDTDVFGFDWDGQVATNIQWVGNYKTGIYKSIDDMIEQEVFKEKEIEVEIPTPAVVTSPDEDGEIRHEEYETIKTCIENDIPVYLVGPAGSGKNYTLEQIAWDLGLDFYFTNSVQQEYKLTGFIDAGGTYHETEFYKAFTKGGLFFLDEIDASIPEVLVLLNAAIANKYFEFPTGKADAHENFRVVAAGNTMGSGADEQYTGRLVLDQATMDRFTIIPFDYDRNIELHIAKGNIDLVDFIRGLRKQAEDKGIRATFSYRCISVVQKLEGKLELTKLIKIAVMKGMDQDTINTFQTYSLPQNTYTTALKKVQAM